MNWFQIGWFSVLTGSCVVLIYLVGSLMGQVRFLKRKVYLQEEKIVLLSNENLMIHDYLRDHCMFCMYDMDPDGKEEDAK